jgi:hypothetical protein
VPASALCIGTIRVTEAKNGTTFKIDATGIATGKHGFHPGFLHRPADAKLSPALTPRPPTRHRLLNEVLIPSSCASWETTQML